MTLKARIEKLETLHKANSQLLVLDLRGGETQADVLSRWCKETGKTEPSLVVFIRRFGS
jgi:hypothetical protein